MKEYFTSSAELQTGEIADDFTYYFALSEQVPSSVGLGVLVNTDQRVLASGGYILQIMPNIKEETIEHLETIIKGLPPVSKMIADGLTPEDILHKLADGTETLLSKYPISYECHCSKEGFTRSLSALDDQTLDELIHEDGQAEIECHFCHTKYVFSKEELSQIKKDRKSS